MADKLAPSERHKFVHQGRTVYEWDQTLAEVNLYVPVPPGVRAKQLFCDVERQHLRFGLAPNPPFLDADLFGAVKVSESYWTLEDGELHVTLTKAAAGEPWRCAIAGHELDAAAEQRDTQRLMLERFQREHPGFDFSGAAFNGEAPNPATFLGGLPGGAGG